MAGRLENPATTVIQGTLVNAVLETALDSTRPGQTRAIVTRDVFGFDGTRLLIPRGTRLYGSYEADVAQGQKRAQIRWTRLLRPDGASVALDSPAADPLGRAGIEGRVNNHFFQRVGNALVGTTASIGSALVTRNIATSPVVVAVPDATPAIPQVAQSSPSQIAPTLTVRQGTRISVFVQHDLDFTSVEQAQ
jgi:type IV secretion system protein VirB10